MEDIKDISQILNFRYKLRYIDSWWDLKVSGTKPSDECIEKYLRPKPEVFSNFKSVFFHNNNKLINEQINEASDNIFCDVTGGFDNLIHFVNQNNSKFEYLVCAGDDTHLSKNIQHLRKIKHKFKKIYYEAKNIECDWIQTIPMGMIMVYMLRNGGNDVILPQINKKKDKTKLIASAFSSRFPHLTEQISDRLELKNFTSNCDFMDDMFCNPIEYYENLCDYKFFACPLGNGIQTPKICECIMCETVPVVIDHVVHRELRDIYNLPLLIVNEWSDLTQVFLNNQWDAVYSKVNWHDQKSKFLVNNFNKLLI